MSLAVIGIDPTKTRTSAEGAEFKVGTRGAVLDQTTGSVVKEYVYVSSATLQVVGDANQISSTGAAVPATLTTSAPGGTSGFRVGVAVSAIPASGYGWMQIYGVGSVSVLASCVRNTQLNTTATAGALDDDAGAGSEVIDGLRLSATATGAAVTACFLNYPSVGRTL